MSRKQKTRFIVYCLLFIVVLFLFFFRLGSTSLTNWDEAWFASVAADMAERKDFLVGFWNGQVWFYEPPILTWVLTVVTLIAGNQEFWLRSFNALSGYVTVFITGILAWRLTGKKIAGVLSSLVLLSDIEFLFRSRQINVEIPVTFFLLASLTSAFMAGKTGRSKWYVSTGLFLGLSFLTKRASPILAIPALAYSFWRDGSKKTLEKIFLSLLVVSAVTLPWFSYQYWRFGDQFVNEFFIGYTLGKIRAVNPGSGTSPLFYLNALKHAFKLWSVAMPIAVLGAAVRAKTRWEYRTLLVYIATFFLALSAASIKSSWFLLPIHPILAIVVGSFLVNLGTRMGRIGSFTLIPTVLTISAVQVFMYRHQFIVPDTTGHQVRLVQQAATYMSPDQPLYLDDGYLPVAVFYGGRRVIPLRFDRAQPIIDLGVPIGSIVLSNTDTFEQLRNHIDSPIETLATKQDLLLLRVGSQEEQEDQKEESGKGKVRS